MKKTQLNRRSFIKQTGMAAGAVSAISAFPNILSASPDGPKNGKLNCVQIGCGGRSHDHFESILGKNKQIPYAVVDPDKRKFDYVREYLAKLGLDPNSTQYFSDYREMYDKIGKNVDAVFIATPNHHHAPASMLALEAGINVYCEKPLCHDIAEARRMREMAAKYPKLATQMGNQGHCEDGYRSLCEFIWAGVIGNVTETHSWTDRANGFDTPRPHAQPPPAGMDWDAWIGPAPYRDYHANLHPHSWHGWYDFGNGSIGNMGCHILDGVFWALKVEDPESIELIQKRGGTDECYPVGSRLCWNISARGDMPALKAYWYEGLNSSTTDKPGGKMQQAQGKARNLPSLIAEIQKQYPDEEFDNNGTIYVGDKGMIYTGTYGEKFRMIPMEKMEGITRPPKTLPRPKDPFTDFITAVREGRTNTATPFEYGSRLTEFAILGNLAQHLETGAKIEWDGPAMKVKNIPELNGWLQRSYRTGWTV